MNVRELESLLSYVKDKNLEVVIMEPQRSHGDNSPCPRSPKVQLVPEESWSAEGSDGRRTLLERTIKVYL